MSATSFLKKVDFSLNDKDFREMKGQVDEFIEDLRKSVKRNKIDADVFLGGSFAKGTVARADRYDADVFVRFDWKYEDLSFHLEKVIKGLGRNFDKLHGSRDYFRVSGPGKMVFEVIPVLRIKKVREARNVTDLSYFHVNFVRRRLKGKMKKELALAKKFCQANGFYGAESYIRGFSGYGLECLTIYYGTFEKMLRELAKIKDEKKIIDIKKFYKRKEEVVFSLNESKMHSPIVLVDPTWKERNVLASLSWETFRKFQAKAREFLSRPSERFFEFTDKKQEEVEKIAKSKKAEFLLVGLKTDRQEGDIAGTKMKKFSEFLVAELGKYFEVLARDFDYLGGQESEVYFALKSRREIIRLGPPLDKTKSVAAFEKANHSKTFRKNGQIYAREKIDFSGRKFLEKWGKSKEGLRKMKDMGIIGLKLD